MYTVYVIVFVFSAPKAVFYNLDFNIYNFR
jgi:hypothetical protein